VEEILEEVSQQSNTLVLIPPLDRLIVSKTIMPLQYGEIKEEKEAIAYTMPFVI